MSCNLLVYVLVYSSIMNKHQKIKLPASVRKHIRQEKAHIRREFLDEEKSRGLIEKLYKKFSHYVNEPEDKKHHQGIKLEKKKLDKKTTVKKINSKVRVKNKEKIAA